MIIASSEGLLDSWRPFPGGLSFLGFDRAAIFYKIQKRMGFVFMFANCLRTDAYFLAPNKKTALISSIRTVTYVGSGGRT